MQNESNKWQFRQELPSLISDLLYPSQSETNSIYLPKLEPGRGLCEVPNPGGNQLPQLTPAAQRERHSRTLLPDPDWRERECRFSEITRVPFPFICSAVLVSLSAVAAVGPFCISECQTHAQHCMFITYRSLKGAEKEGRLPAPGSYTDVPSAPQPVGRDSLINLPALTPCLLLCCLPSPYLGTAFQFLLSLFVGKSKQ